MTYAEYYPWTCVFTKQGSSLIDYHQFQTRDEADAFAAMINKHPRQHVDVMTTERAMWFKENQVYVY